MPGAKTWPRLSLIRLKGGEAVRQIDFCDWRGWVFFWAGSDSYSPHLMNRSGADSECFSHFEESCPGRQLLADAIDDCLTHQATPEALALCSDARGSIDASSAITRLSMINLMLSASGSGKPLSKDQGDSIDLENRKGR
jgi:hypothetical protein